MVVVLVGWGGVTGKKERCRVLGQTVVLCMYTVLLSQQGHAQTACILQQGHAQTDRLDARIQSGGISRRTTKRKEKDTKKGPPQQNERRNTPRRDRHSSMSH